MQTNVRPKQIKKHLKAGEKAIKEANKPKAEPKEVKPPQLY